MSSQILLLPGDGIGPEVVREARRVLEAVDDQFSLELSFSEGRLGGVEDEGGMRRRGLGPLSRVRRRPLSTGVASTA